MSFSECDRRPEERCVACGRVFDEWISARGLIVKPTWARIPCFPDASGCFALSRIQDNSSGVIKFLPA
eukprot:8327768-Lingulodinium_polyedra.AAC.1